MEFNIFEYNLFHLGPIGFGFGFIAFLCIGILIGCFDPDLHKEPPYFKPGMEAKLGRFLLGIVIGLFYGIGYVVMKFMGVGCWKLLLIFWDNLAVPIFSALSSVLDAIYSYESK